MATSRDGDQPNPAEDEKSPSGSESRQRAVVGGIWMAIAQFVPLFGTALLSITIGRILGPELLGLQSFISYVDALLSALVLQVVTVMSIRLLSESIGAKDESAFAHLARVTFVANMAAGAISALVLTGIGLASDNPIPWLVVSLSSLINGVGWGYGSILVATRGWRSVSSRRLVTQSLAMVLGVVAILAGFGITGVFAANAVGALLVLVWLRRTLGPLKWGAVRPLPHRLARVWGQLLVMELLLQVVQRRMEFLFLQAYSTEVQLAMYSIGFMVVSTAAILPMSLVEAGLPGVSESLGAGTIERTSKMLGSALRIVSVASLPLTAGVVCLGPVLVLVLYGGDYQLAADLVPLMGLSLILVTSGNLCATFWIGADRLRLPIIGASIGAVVDLSLAWLLVADHGAWGAAIANLAGQTTMAVIMLALTWRTAGRFPVMAGRWLGVLLYSAVVAAIVLAVIGAIGTGSGSAALLALLAGGVVFVILMLGLGSTAGFVHGDDAAWLHEALPGKLRRWAWLFTGRRSRQLR